tara:strand:- start:42 stop:2228 length:2187 start_codon:yes stop_codon:yes gene_type:complete
MIFRKSKLLLTIIFFLNFFQSSYSNEIIIPKKKPLFRSQIIIPPIKPVSTIIKKSLENDKDLPKQISGILVPPKKPLIVKKQTLRSVKKTRYYSERDFEFAKQAIRFMEKSNWKDAKNTAKKARAQSIYDFIQWRHLLTSGNKATFTEYKKFIERVKDYPRFDRIKYLAEHKINQKNQSPTDIINWFAKADPLSGYGKMILGESFIKVGKSAQGIKLIKEGFINADLSTNDLKYFRKKFKKILDTSDYIKRADHYAWEGKHWDLKRIIRYLPNDYQLLYTARQILISRGYGVDDAIKKIPKNLKNDPGLKYDRLKWRRKKGRIDSSLEILYDIKNTQEYLVRPDKWWKERSIIARSLIYKKKYKSAYKIVANHAMTFGADFAEAEWMSGWIALSFLNNPQLAENHFKNFYENVSYPISLSRGAYWLGRTYENIGDKEKSNIWYIEGSKYLTTYYGQLSHLKVKPKEKFELDKLMFVDDNYEKEFYSKKLVAIVDLLDYLNKDKYTKHILRFLANDNIEKGSEVLAAKLATDISRFDFAIQVSKIASYQKRFHNQFNYPIMSIPKFVGGRKIPDPALILSIIRQESEFDTSAKSRVGAQGLMQLMPYTAKTVSKQAKLGYSKSKLTSDPEYNINLGSHYIAGLISNYKGSYPFATAAYNAGPKRVKYWKKLNKDPQKKQIDYVDWIELIKFKETRNYVQRVLENYNVYRYILSQKPIYLSDFFKNKTLY